MYSDSFTIPRPISMQYARLITLYAQIWAYPYTGMHAMAKPKMLDQLFFVNAFDTAFYKADASFVFID